MEFGLDVNGRNTHTDTLALKEPGEGVCARAQVMRAAVEEWEMEKCEGERDVDLRMERERTSYSVPATT